MRKLWFSTSFTAWVSSATPIAIARLLFLNSETLWLTSAGKRVAHRLRHQHVAHRADVAVAERARGLGLAGRDRAQAGAQILAEIGGLAEAQRDDGEDRLAVVIVEPVLQRVGQQAGDAEVPEHQLHERRHVAVIGDIGRDRPIGDAARA